MKTKINLNFENLVDFKIDKRIVKKIIKILFDMPKITENCCLKDKIFDTLSVDFVVCDDEFIHKINKEYRKKDKPTDVITFALFCDDPNSVDLNEINLGEIIISIDTAKKQAQTANHSLENEVYYLVTHGILHLLGFDHMTDAEYNFMVETQMEVMKGLNYV